MRFVIEADVERVEGKFASRDEIEEYIQNELDGANPSTVDGVGADGASSYEITEWEVSVEPPT